MIEIKNTINLNFIFDSNNNQLGLSFSEYARFVLKPESTIRARGIKERYFGKIYLVTLKGVKYKLIPVDLCLQWLLEDKPEKINVFVEDVYNLTGIKLNFPDFCMKESLEAKRKEYNPKGLIYLFESELNLLKLGFTKNVKQRMSQLQRWERELTVLDVVEGTIYKEKEIHKILHATGEFYGDEWYPINRKQEILQILNYSKV
ncbi:hypothetical protein Pam2_51 [Pseudanabaena phage Pam2]|nr:hypothetical protein Pam2_51 [Pseudanabaena phage Pam2]